MKIFLDDIRKIDEELKFNVVRTYDDCVELLRKFGSIVKTISLDYSLGTEKNGYDVLVYLVENKIFPENINIHSDHAEGVPKMLKFAKENFPNSNITCNRV